MAALLASAALLDAPPAVACSVADSCVVDQLPAGALVPSNAPALGFERVAGSSVKDVDVTIIDSAGISLLQATKVAVPGVLPLEGKLASGKVYTLRVKPSGKTCDERVRPFRSGVPSASPRRVGTAGVSYSVTKGGYRSGGIMGPPIVEVDEGSKVATADIAIVPDEGLVPFLSLVRFETFVDGKPWGRSERGGGVKRIGADTDVTTVPDFTRIYAQCPTASDASTSSNSCFREGTGLGQHEVEIRANVPGMTDELEPIRLSIDLRCSSSAGAAATTPPAIAAGGGCSVGAPSSVSWPSALLLVAAIALGRARRRRTVRPPEGVSAGRLVTLLLVTACAACSEPAKAGAADASDERSCWCTAVACRSGATIKFASPVPVAELESASLEVCRLPEDCVRVLLLKGTPPTPSLDVTIDGQQIHARWSGTIADGDAYRATLTGPDGGVVFRAEAPAGYFGVRVNECHYEGTRESCGHGADCKQAVVPLVNALDAGADVSTD